MMIDFEVLIVEDELINAKVLRGFLENKGYKVIDVLTSGEAALEFVKKKKPDLILMDIELEKELNGIETIELINQVEKIPVLYITSHTDRELVDRAKETKPVGYIIKPFSPLQLEISLDMAREKVLVDKELMHYQLYLEHLVVDRTKELIEEVKLNKAARQLAIDNEIKLKAITTAANDAIVLFDEYGQIKFWNNAAEKMFQYEEEEILDNNIRILFSSDNENDEFAKGLEIIQYAIDENELSENIEFAATKADGSELPVEMSLASVNINNERFVLSIVRDISQRKHDLEEIKRFKLISDLANYGLAITDEFGEFVYVNKYFSELIEYDQEEMLGKSFFMITPHVHKSEIASFVEKSSNLHGGEGLELMVVNKSEKEIPIMFNSVIICDKYDEPKFYALSATDIRERKEYEENILRAKKLAEDSDRMKTAFLSTISHELRTPLNAIIGFAELIRVTEVDMDDVKDFNDEIYKGGNHLLSIVEDILDVSLLESKDLKIYPVEFSLNNLMKNVFQKFKSNQRYANPNITLKWDGRKVDGEDLFFTDNSKLEQIFNKLIDNAYKFSEKGTIEFGYNYSEEKKLYSFYVKDEGKGIQQTKLTDIFESFKQAEEGGNRAHNGLGLGLSIVNQLLELMQGDISVKSELGKGSTFTFNIQQNQS